MVQSFILLSSSPSDAVDNEAAQVCLNKILPLCYLTDLNTPPPLTCAAASPAPIQALNIKIKHFTLRCYIDDSAITRDLTSSSIYYLRRRRSTHLSVIRNELLHQLCSPVFNRHCARSSTWVQELSAPLRPPLVWSSSSTSLFPQYLSGRHGGNRVGRGARAPPTARRPVECLLKLY
jgi:hypothetical protein